MSICFYPVAQSGKDCPICYEPMHDVEGGTIKKAIVAHNGIDGEKHPMHKECIKKWLNIISQCPVKCPVCNIQVDGNLKFKLKEKDQEAETRILIAVGGAMAVTALAVKTMGVERVASVVADVAGQIFIGVLKECLTKRAIILLILAVL